MSNHGSLLGITILLVEDDPDSRWLFERVFTDQEGIVVAVTDAFEALRIVGSQRIDVIVSDIGLPGLDGYDLLKAIRAFEQESITGGMQPAHVPAIAVSAYTEVDSQRRALAAGFDRYMSKPTDIAVLVATVAGLGRKDLH